MKIKIILCLMTLFTIPRIDAQVSISGHVAYVCDSEYGSGTVTFYSYAFTGSAQNYSVRIGASSNPSLNPVIFSGTVFTSNFSFSQSTSLTVGHYIRISVTSGSYSDTKDFVISRLNTPGQPTISPGYAEICPSGSQSLTASGGSGSYQWYRDGSPVTGFGNSYSASSGGTYTVTEQNSCGISSSSGGASVVELTVPGAPSISTNSYKICPGQSATLSASGSGNILLYLNGGYYTSGSSTSTTTSGTYYAVAQNVCGTSGGSGSIYIAPGNRLPASGTLTFSMINTALGRSANQANTTLSALIWAADSQVPKSTPHRISYFYNYCY